jgi:SAM-dependent methyltransferase
MTKIATKRVLTLSGRILTPIAELSKKIMIDRLLPAIKRQHWIPGLTRFHIERFIYRITLLYPKSRNLKWDFILGYLPNLTYNFFRGKIKVLDIGCTDSLLMYELGLRGYLTYGLDVRDYGEKLPVYIQFSKVDFLTFPFPESVKESLDYIIASSIIELIGTGQYDDKHATPMDRVAMEKIHSLLKADGILLITVTSTYWRSHTARGYSIREFVELVSGLFRIIEISHKGGLICAALTKEWQSRK